MSLKRASPTRRRIPSELQLKVAGALRQLRDSASGLKYCPMAVSKLFVLTFARAASVYRPAREGRCSAHHLPRPSQRSRIAGRCRFLCQQNRQ